MGKTITAGGGELIMVGDRNAAVCLFYNTMLLKIVYYVGGRLPVQSHLRRKKVQRKGKGLQSGAIRVSR
jgi:hypothetical protein